MFIAVATKSPSNKVVMVPGSPPIFYDRSGTTLGGASTSPAKNPMAKVTDGDTLMIKSERDNKMGNSSRSYLLRWL